MSFVYLTFQPADYEFALNLRNQLESEGYHTWLAEVRQPDEQLLVVMQGAINTAAAMVVVNSPGMDADQLIRREISTARTAGVPVWAVSVDDDIEAMIRRLGSWLAPPDESIVLPIPLQENYAAAPSHSLMSRAAWLALIIGLVIASLWLVQFFLLPSTSANQNTPTPSRTATITPSPTARREILILPSETPTPTFSATETSPATTTPTATVTPSSSFTPTMSQTPSATLTATPTATHTASPTQTPSPTPSRTSTPTWTATPSPSPTVTPLIWPSALFGEKWLTNTPGGPPP